MFQRELPGRDRAARITPTVQGAPTLTTLLNTTLKEQLEERNLGKNAK
jgi:hypothetical protein